MIWRHNRSFSVSFSVSSSHLDDVGRFHYAQRLLYVASNDPRWTLDCHCLGQAGTKKAVITFQRSINDNGNFPLQIKTAFCFIFCAYVKPVCQSGSYWRLWGTRSTAGSSRRSLLLPGIFGDQTCLSPQTHSPPRNHKHTSRSLNTRQARR